MYNLFVVLCYLSTIVCLWKICTVLIPKGNRYWCCKSNTKGLGLKSHPNTHQKLTIFFFFFQVFFFFLMYYTVIKTSGPSGTQFSSEGDRSTMAQRFWMLYCVHKMKLLSLLQIADWHGLNHLQLNLRVHIWEYMFGLNHWNWILRLQFIMILITPTPHPQLLLLVSL